MSIEEYASRIIVSLDPPGGVEIGEWLERVYTSLKGLVAGWKVGWPLILRWGVERVRSFLASASGVRLLDLKLADIYNTMRSVVDVFVDVVDAVIAHSFIGVEGALAELKKLLEEYGVKLVLVYTMSHPGASEVMDQCLDRIDEVVERVKPWGLVAPATRPSLVSRARRRYGDLVIFSPGVGAQGAAPGSAICAGADYEIIGRSIVASPDPLRSVYGLSASAAKILSSCT